MKDTPDAIEAKFHAMILARSPAERLSMACKMFTTAKALIAAGLLQEYGELDQNELRRRIFLRLYADDFDEVDREKILTLLTVS